MLMIDKKLGLPPEPPEPPLSIFRLTFDFRISGYCPKCRSHIIRKWPFFGKSVCINPRCGHTL